MKKLFVVLLVLCFSIEMEAQISKDILEVRAILFEQQDRWNQGDIPGFMEYYIKSDGLLFGGASGLTYGWQNTLDRYQESYPDKAAMGELTFEVKDVKKLNRKTILLNGSWSLMRANDNPGGHFMLVWKKVKGEWLIMADHTSALCPE